MKVNKPHRKKERNKTKQKQIILITLMTAVSNNFLSHISFITYN